MRCYCMHMVLETIEPDICGQGRPHPTREFQGDAKHEAIGATPRSYHTEHAISGRDALLNQVIPGYKDRVQ